jgi:uroporphyrinogen decarboxylase
MATGNIRRSRRNPRPKKGQKEKNKVNKMNSRERVLAILNNEAVDRIPIDIWYTPEIGDALKKYYNVQDDFQLYDAMGLDKIVLIIPEYRKTPDGESAGSQIGVGAQTSGGKTMWGVPLKEMQAGKAVYHEFGEPPLKDYNTPESLKDYPYWPDVDGFDYDSAVNMAKRASQNYATLGPWVSFFEIYCQMRGLEQSMIDIALSPELADAILDKIEYCQTEMMKRLFGKAADYIDMCFISDDMGSQESLLLSPQFWDRYFKDRMTRWCEFIHSYGIKVFYHTDGASEELIPQLIDCGIDVLNPIQHVCPGMGMAGLKDKYGDRLIFHGGVENQSVLPFGTAEQVKQETLDCLNTLGRDGKGYIVCSCHNIQPGTPVENIISMVETVKNSGVITM